jgi:hypothetical protein
MVIAGKAVENEAIIPVVLFQSSLDDFLDNLVGNQRPGGNNAAYAGGELGAALDVPAKISPTLMCTRSKS